MLLVMVNSIFSCQNKNNETTKSNGTSIAVEDFFATRKDITPENNAAWLETFIKLDKGGVYGVYECRDFYSADGIAYFFDEETTINTRKYENVRVRILNNAIDLNNLKSTKELRSKIAYRKIGIDSCFYGFAESEEVFDESKKILNNLIAEFEINYTRFPNYNRYSSGDYYAPKLKDKLNDDDKDKAEKLNASLQKIDKAIPVATDLINKELKKRVIRKNTEWQISEYELVYNGSGYGEYKKEYEENCKYCRYYYIGNIEAGRHSVVGSFSTIEIKGVDYITIPFCFAAICHGLAEGELLEDSAVAYNTQTGDFYYFDFPYAWTVDGSYDEWEKDYEKYKSNPANWIYLGNKKL